MPDETPFHLDAYWMAFTQNRQVETSRRRFIDAEGTHVRIVEDQALLDGTPGRAGWPAGHEPGVSGKIGSRQFDILDYSPAFAALLQTYETGLLTGATAGTTARSPPWMIERPHFHCTCEAPNLNPREVP